nr:hypothetical protein [Tanacetum cinerariifolium]
MGTSTKAYHPYNSDKVSTGGGGGVGSVDVVLVVTVKLKGTSANAVRALKKFVLCRVSKRSEDWVLLLLL